MKKIIGIVLFLALLGGGYGYYLYHKPVGSLSAQSVDYQVDAEKLLSEFETAETAANEKYLGKIIEVSGTIKQITTKEDGLKSLTLEANSLMSGVIAELDAKNSEQTFEKGQKIKLKGECSGYLMDVVLVRCVVDEW